MKDVSINPVKPPRFTEGFFASGGVTIGIGFLRKRERGVGIGVGHALSVVHRIRRRLVVKLGAD